VGQLEGNVPVSLQIMTQRQVDQTLNRLAYEVVERNRGASNVTVFGILRDGAKIARLIAHQIGSIEGVTVPVHDLDITAFRDDTPDASTADENQSSGYTGAVESTKMAGSPDVTDRDVLLVDDVLYTGRTIRAALDAVIRYGRPRTIQLMVLLDRGHREYPIQTDYVGRTIVTKASDRVDVVSNGQGSAVFVEESDG